LERSGGFNEEDVPYTSQDIRFTVKGDALYATVLDWPGEELVITTFREAEEGKADVGVVDWDDPCYRLYESEIVSVTMLGDDKLLKWKLEKRGLVVRMPERKPCEHAFVVKIVRKKPYG
jgi:alpha-L-fucosidase